MPSPVRKTRGAWGVYVSRVLAERGLSLRQARDLTGINHATLSDMANGFVPRVETVAAFAQGLSLSLSECLRQSGYEELVTRIRAEVEAEAREEASGG